MLDHSWNLTPREAIARQKELRARLVLAPPPGFAPGTVDIDAAGRLVLAMGRGHREPESARAAHRAVNRTRKTGEIAAR